MKGHNYGLCRKCGKIHSPTRGYSGRRHTIQSRIKMSKTRKERWKDPEYRKAHFPQHLLKFAPTAFKGHKHSEEFKNWQRERLKKRWRNPEYRKKQLIALREGAKKGNERVRELYTGKPRPREVREKIARTLRGKPKPWLRGVNNPMANSQIREKHRKACLRFLENWRSPNKLEQEIIDLIEKYNLPYRFVGDGKFWLENRNPDFINYDGEKKIIEVAGIHWHTPQEIEQRKNHYAKYGFKTLVLWEDDIKQLPQEKILERIRGF